MNLSEIFVYSYQKNLKDKIKRRDLSLRIIAIPEISKFFMPPITLDKAIGIYRRYQMRNDLKNLRKLKPSLTEGEFGEQVLSVCRVCLKEELTIDKGISSDELPSGWKVLISEEDQKKETVLICSDKCLQKYIETQKK